MSLEQKNIAIEEFLASEIIKRGKLLSHSTDVKLVVEKLCINGCGGRWDFGSYFFIDDTINIYFKFIDEASGIRDISKHNFSKSQVTEFVYKYMENGNDFSILEKQEKVEPIKAKAKKKVKEEKNEQISLF